LAIKTVKIPDELMEKLEARDPKNPLAALNALLARFIDVEPADRTLFVPREARQILEAIYGKPIDSTNVDAFARAVKRTAQICVGEAKVVPTESQIKSIEYEARAHHLTAAQLIERELPLLIANRWGF
jgi:hypothetical protein